MIYISMITTLFAIYYRAIECLMIATKNKRAVKKYYLFTLFNKKPLKTVWPDCKAATKFEKIDWEQA